MDTTHTGTMEELAAFLHQRAGQAREIGKVADKAHKPKFDGQAEGLEEASVIVKQWRLPGAHAAGNGEAVPPTQYGQPMRATTPPGGGLLEPGLLEPGR